MKKVLFALSVLASLSFTASAETYIRFNASQSQNELASSVQSLDDKGSPALTSSLVSGKTTGVGLGIGFKFNDYVALEARHNWSLHDSYSEKPLHPEGSVNILNKVADNGKTEVLLLLSTQEYYGFQPYIHGGMTLFDINYNGRGIQESGVTYGFGINYKVNDKWFASLEYAESPQIKSLTSSGGSKKEDGKGKKSDGPLKHYRSTLDHKSRIMISISYKF